MKTLVTGLLGTGAFAVVLLAYLSLHGQQEVKNEVHVDKAKIEVEAAKFDKSFDDKWAAMSGKKTSKDELAQHEKRIAQAEDSLDEAKKKLATAQRASERDLAEIKAAIDDLDGKQIEQKEIAK